METLDWQLYQSGGQRPISFSLNNYINTSLDPNITKMSSLWDPSSRGEIRISINMAGDLRNLYQIDEHLSMYQPKPFDLFNKEINYLLLERQPNENKWCITILDPDEYAELKDSFQKNRFERDPSDLFLYGLSLGYLFSKSKNLSVEQLNQDRNLAYLLAQVKFYGGSGDFTRREAQELAGWLKEKEASKPLQFFERYIIKNPSRYRILMEQLEKLTD